jgi:hypothetical protein
MKLNHFFNPKRFFYFVSAYLQMNYKRYLFIFAGAAICFYLFFLFIMQDPLSGMSNRYSKFDGGSYNFVFIFYLLPLFAFFGSTFPELSDKIKTGNYLLLPASTFEKFFSQFLIYIAGGTAVFLLLFWADAHLARWTLFLYEPVRSGQLVIEPFRFSMLFHFDGDNGNWDRILYILVACSAGTFMFAARLFFQRFALVKSAIAGSVLAFLLFICMTALSHLFYPNDVTGLNSSPIFFPVYDVIEGVTNIAVLFYFITCCCLFFFLPLAYFKFKEKQL